MIRNSLLSLLFISCYFLFYGQESTIRGIVVDQMGNPVVSAEIINFKGRHIQRTDELGRFSFKGRINIKYGVVKDGYALTWFKGESAEDPLRIVMDIEVQEIESVVITRKGSEDALDLANVNIIDYQPLQGYILTLKKKKDTYYVGIDSLNTEGLSIPLSIWRPQSLYFDCMENTFILNKDSAYQFVILDGEMEYISKMPIAMFNTYIKPCVAEFDKALVLSDLTNHNKQYSLTRYENGKGSTFFVRMDSIGYRVAAEDALLLGQLNGNELIGDSLNDSALDRRRKMREIHNGENPDVNIQMLNNAVQSEALQTAEPLSVPERAEIERQMALSQYNNPGSRWAQLQSSYILRSQPVKISSFQIAQYVATVDYDADSVILFDASGSRVQSVPYYVPCEVKEVWQDLSNGFLYLYAKDRGNHKLFSLNALTGEVQYLKNFRGVSQTESGLVYDGWLYYKTIENGFYGINRIRLPEQNF